MRLLRALAPIATIVAASGCGYVHFGRLPVAKAGDAALLDAYTDLTIQQKILKQELVLTRKENESLRTAVDRGDGNAAAQSDLARQLEQTSRELAQLRVSYAKLQDERNTAAADVTTATRLGSVEAENAKLQRELAGARSENASLAAQLRATLDRNGQMQTRLAELDGALREQSLAREQAEKAVADLRLQLDAVVVRAGRAEQVVSPSGQDVAPVRPPPAGQSAPVALAELRQAKAPPSDAAFQTEIRATIPRMRSSEQAAPEPSARSVSSQSVPAAAASSSSTYTVQMGDTLEKIALRLYGSAEDWSRIYAANTDLLAKSQGLKAGMVLEIPAK